MRRFTFLKAAVCALALCMPAAPAFAQQTHTDTDHVRGMGSDVQAHDPGAGDEHGHVPHFSDINWFYGLLGEQDDVEPSLLWRPKGMPVPFGAMLINTGILFFLLVRFGKRPIAEALKKRKAAIMTGMDEAAKMREEAAARLKDYESKLEQIDQEVERVRREMRAAGEAERARILADAKDKQARMERDARMLVDQELKAAREQLTAEIVHSAMRSAEDRLRRQVTASDQQRLAEEYLAAIGRALGGRV